MTLLNEVRAILFAEWDPIGVNQEPACRNEYDSYAPAICRMLQQGKPENEIASHLGELMRVSMGLSRVNDEHNRKVAKRLLGLMK